MRFVKKFIKTPIEFTEAIKEVEQYKFVYNNQKKPLLQVLLNEQNGLCAYCNQGITLENATVEHLLCQSHNSIYELNYHNLFAVCNGNEGVVRTSHCDKYRANGVKNDYFFPFILFEQCITQSWSMVNPFFDVEYTPKLQIISGRIIGKEKYIKGYPSIKKNIDGAINKLNLNADILVAARKAKWLEVIKTKQKMNCGWQDLFNYYFNTEPFTAFYEFILLAIRKQEI